MDINELITRIKKNGYEKPNIAVITPEIRTIDERVNPSIGEETDSRIEILEAE